MAAGDYKSEEAMMAEALVALADRRLSLEGIARGLEDAKAGRMRSWAACKRDLLKRRPNLADQ
jgi:predicted transcriptional regulator